MAKSPIHYGLDRSCERMLCWINELGLIAFLHYFQGSLESVKDDALQLLITLFSSFQDGFQVSLKSINIFVKVFLLFYFNLVKQYLLFIITFQDWFFLN